MRHRMETALRRSGCSQALPHPFFDAQERIAATLGREGLAGCSGSASLGRTYVLSWRDEQYSYFLARPAATSDAKAESARVQLLIAPSQASPEQWFLDPYQPGGVPDSEPVNLQA